MNTDDIYKQMIDFLPFPAIIHQDMKIVYANDKAAKFVGYSSKEEIFSKSIFDFVAEESKKVAIERINLMSQRKVFVEPLVEKVVDKNKKIIEVEISAKWILFNGRTAIFLIIKDRTPLKVAYEEIQKRNIELENIRRANLNIIEDLKRENEKREKIEVDLTISEKRSRTIFEFSSYAVFIIKGNEFVDFNKEATKIFGCKKSDLIGKTPIDFSPEYQPDGEKSSEKASKFIRKAYAGYPQIFEWKHKKLNGELFDAEVRLSILRLGNEKYLMASVQDITERKNMLKNLAASEERFRKLALNTSTFIFVYKGTKFVFANKAFLNFIGYSKKELFSINFWDLVHPDFKEMIRERGLKRQRGEKVPKRYEFKVITKRGKERWVDFSADKIIWNGEPAGLGSAFDITERKLAEQALRESELRFRSLADLLPVAVFETDNNYKITYANRKAFQLFGYTERDLKRSIYGLDMIRPELRKQIVHDLNKIDLGDYEGITETIALRKDASNFHDVFRIAPIFKEGEKIGYRGVVEDVTHIKKSETLLKIQYEIADTVLTAKNLRELFEIVQFELNKVIDANNLFYAEYLSTEKKFVSPFEKDESDSILEWKAEGSLTGYLLKSKKSTLLLNKSEIKKLIKSKKIKRVGSLPEQWLGTVVEVKGKKTGVLVVQSYNNQSAYDKYSVEIIEIIARQISSYIEQKKVEAEMIKLFRAVEESPNAIIITDANWKVEYANPKVKDITGFSKIEILGRNAMIIKPDFKRHFDVENIKKKLLKGETWTGEFFSKRKNGESYWARGSLSPLFDENGNINNYVILLEDFTEIKVKEEKIIESEIHFRSVWENSYDAMRLVNKKGKIVDVNDAFCNLVGKKREELVGKDFYTIYYDFNEGRKLEKLKKNFTEKDRLKRFESRVRLWNGEQKWLELSNSVLSFKDKEPLLLSIIRDVSQRKEMLRATIEAKEKAEEMNRLKTQFFVYMSHELRTPFMGIMGYAQLLKDEIKDPILQKMTEGILSTSKRMLDTLNEILDVTKLEFDQKEMMIEDVNINMEILNVYNAFLQSAKEKGLTLKKYLPREDFYFRTDKRMIRGILNNLVNNAIKFTEKGFVEVSLRKLKRKNGEYAVIKVKDSGIGIPEDKQSIIWDEFRQVSEGASRSYQGSGLGLTIVKKYVEMMKGKISLKSEVGKGSVFTIELPSN